MAFRVRPSYPWVIFIVLCALGIFAAVAPTSSPTATGYNEPDSLWRKTKDGWELAWWLQRPKEFHKPAIHPLTVAGCQLVIVSLLGLLGHRRPRYARQLPGTIIPLRGVTPANDIASPTIDEGECNNGAHGE